MSRKLIISIIIILFLALGVAVYFAYTGNSGTNAGGEQKSLLGSLFPFGKNDVTPGTGTNTPGSNPDGTPDDPENPQAPRRLTLVSDKVLAGYTVRPEASITPEYNINDTSGESTQAGDRTPILRFVERGTGYIYDINARGQSGKKISSTVIARTAQALFADGGASVILRYIKNDNITVATFLGHVTAPVTSTADGTLKGDFLPDNLVDITVSPDQKNILFLLPTAGGVAGISMKADGTGKKQLFSSSFSEWLLDWPTTAPVLTTKASADVKGYAYQVIKTGVFQSLIGNINGLTTKTSADGKYLLYSVSGGKGLTLHLKNLTNGTDYNLGLQTLPEKCTWSADKNAAYCAASKSLAAAAYPDAWYQGTMAFNDSFWRVDLASGKTIEANDGEKENLDAVNLSQDEHGQYLFFMNKNDGSLWSLNLSPVPTSLPTPSLPTVQ